MKTLFVSYECAPFVKLGGLADVALGLPKALKKLKTDSRVMIPLFSKKVTEKDLKLILKNIKVKFGSQNLTFNLYQSFLPASKTPIYFIDNKKYFGGEIFGKAEMERFIFFSRAALTAIKELNWQPNVIHANDWHTGALIMYLNDLKKEDAFYKNIKSLYTVHNLGYQGVFPLKNVIKFIPKKLFARSKDANLMAEGVLGADGVSTVSKTYAKEVLTKEYGHGLENVLKSLKKVNGIVNGIDYDFFNPIKDTFIKHKFTPAGVLSGKKKNKKHLEKICKFKNSPDTPIIGIVSRLASQKGLNLLTDIVDDLVKLDLRFVILGSGEEEIENDLKAAMKKYPQKFYVLTGVFAAKFGREIYAGSDMFLMPSKYEPCGLGQMIAMRYGTVPVVRATGGLKDTIKNNKDGFVFKKMESKKLLKIIKKAVNTYKKPAKWNKIVKTCIKKDFTWTRSAREYIKLYKSL